MHGAQPVSVANLKLLLRLSDGLNDAHQIVSLEAFQVLLELLNDILGRIIHLQSSKLEHLRGQPELLFDHRRRGRLERLSVLIVLVQGRYEVEAKARVVEVRACHICRLCMVVVVKLQLLEVLFIE